ncbi:DUF3822 family protein [Echinicola sp. CAU 1574]|uniref:DUF3822 family protein n=1 Tax=Echinicola arenosa TaxID=2774144 RepID=A0ABR9AG26_9BACT|nr:DUF3822 family protein [Echinicola arenosa]MBD8487706.1 DUF3822 family protein [Echinicola arenosa]
MTTTVKNTHTEFHSDKLDVTATSSLSLLLYPEKLIVIAKNQNDSIMGVNSYPFVEQEELEFSLKKDPFISTAKAKATLFVFNECFCLVPGMLFDPNEKDTYLNFSTPIEDHEVFHAGVDNNKTVVVGGLEKSMAKIFSKRIADLTMAHGAVIALDYLLHERSEMLNQEISIVIEDHQIYVAGFSNKELKFFNRFEVSSNQEFLKYTFSVLHQLAFDRMHCKITLFGNLTDINVQEEVLHQYFKNLALSTPKTNQNYLLGAESFKETQKLSAYWTN